MKRIQTQGQVQNATKPAQKQTRNLITHIQELDGILAGEGLTRKQYADLASKFELWTNALRNALARTSPKRSAPLVFQDLLEPRLATFGAAWSGEKCLGMAVIFHRWGRQLELKGKLMNGTIGRG